MRIGEIAALVGVTPRAVRHHHHLGLLPEPELELDEVRDVLADDQVRELVEVLEEPDEGLARQETFLREQRARLGPLLAEALAGRLDAVVPEEDRGRLMASLHGMKQHAVDVYGLLDALADAEPDDPKVARAAAALAAFLPDDLAAHFPDRSAGALADGIFADLAPAQSAAITVRWNS
ncbi:MerR family transcriptional regulator [Streptomyces sp. NBC_00038]|uniref:MerR family transcriptional regulator n=1 Tax=Streptomyces sp. NBC_00038 TaxID=2903615 RepID=UPI002B1D00C0|nr:MerR family transcriptional regulator [Streptomyces sp. NBC_00038]